MQRVETTEIPSHILALLEDLVVDLRTTTSMIAAISEIVKDHPLPLECPASDRSRAN